MESIHIALLASQFALIHLFTHTHTHLWWQAVHLPDHWDQPEFSVLLSDTLKCRREEPGIYLPNPAHWFTATAVISEMFYGHCAKRWFRILIQSPLISRWSGRHFSLWGLYVVLWITVRWTYFLFLMIHLPKLNQLMANSATLTRKQKTRY